MIKIYGSARSSAGRCYWMLEELQLPYEVMPLNMKEREHKSEDYLKINPNGKIPAIVDGDVTVWESMAITSYLAKKYQSPLAPRTPVEDAHMMQWSFWALVDLQKPAVDWLIQEMFVPEDKRNHQVIEDAKKIIPNYLKTLERGLEGKTYLVDERFTVADLNVASVVHLVNSLGMDLAPHKNIDRWMKACKDRPAFQKLAKMREA
ncbi:glutathione S-transferase family protein [Bdellovibrio reynosensis]|uniref:Glutathione S-transferase family protein n=1 Tax=Bdellovibrio reynosensis TaxID=2835041 RepID=A0ABY4C6U5_9BACT|nr:glutathione S-transferase family protein [Bdellovibrio reynosensis]UOF00697.1 glutathione S-transferase family protein [Bdellovibrio reynosensis]